MEQKLRLKLDLLVVLQDAAPLFAVDRSEAQEYVDDEYYGAERSAHLVCHVFIRIPHCFYFRLVSFVLFLEFKVSNLFRHIAQEDDRYWLLKVLHFLSFNVHVNGAFLSSEGSKVLLILRISKRLLSGQLYPLF